MALLEDKARKEAQIANLMACNGFHAANDAAWKSGYYHICKQVRKAQREVFKKCAVCGKRDRELKACSRCKMVWYCCPEEQKTDWKAAHKGACFSLQQANVDEEARESIKWFVDCIDNKPWTQFQAGQVGDWDTFFTFRPLISNSPTSLVNPATGKLSPHFVAGEDSADELMRAAMRLKSDEYSYAATIANAVLLAGVNMNKGSGKKSKKIPRAPSATGVTYIDLVGASNMIPESSIEIQQLSPLVINLCCMFPSRGELHVRVVGPAMPDSDCVPTMLADGGCFSSTPQYYGAGQVPGDAPAWASIHKADYLSFRRSLPPQKQPDLICLFNPGVMENFQCQWEFLSLLHQLLSSGPGQPPPFIAIGGQRSTAYEPLPLEPGSSVPVLFTEFNEHDLGRLEMFLSEVIPHTPQPHPEVLVRGENPFRSLCTRQVAASVNDVAFNNGSWLVHRPGPWQPR